MTKHDWIIFGLGCRNRTDLFTIFHLKRFFDIASNNTLKILHSRLHCGIIISQFIPIFIAGDIEPPNISKCIHSFTVSTKLTSNQKHVSVYWPEPTAMDNSGMPLFRNRTHTPGDFLPVGVSTVSYTFTDLAKNKAVCSFNITVVAGKITQLYFHLI